MFYDYAKIYVKGGDGGNGIVAFRREKYVPEGGPAGGDGGRGGNVILVANEGLRTLVDLKYKRHYKADRGEHGQGKNMHGKGAEDLVVRIPVGTVVRDAETKEMIADLTVDGQEVVIAKGGRGGKGNTRFATAHDKAPTFAEKGEPGQELWVELELKLLADVGLVGFPNAGKSTIISKISAAKPKIADYPFTTITPNLGVVKAGDEYSFVVADVPGLIEGAHEGVGLGHKFLRHVERTKVLVHVIDMAGTEDRLPWEDFETINNELELYNPALAKRPQIIAANKLDLPGAEDNLMKFSDMYGEKYEIFPVSALDGKGLNELVFKLAEMVRTLPDNPPPMEQDRLYVTIEEEKMTVSEEEGVFVIRGKDIERIVAMTDFDNDAAIERLQRIMERMGVEELLKEHGINEGDTVRIGKMEFDFQENYNPED